MQGRLLVGRDRELRILDDGVAAASRGERAVLMITGEPGIGKTRLLEELVTRVIAAGGIACWGRTWEVGPTPPFSPWREILTALETPSDAAPALGGSEEYGDATARLERFGEVVAFLRRRAAHAPIALLFDDLHAADPSSLQLLEYALPLLIGKRVLFGLAARDLDASREAEAALARLQRGAFRIPLSRLGEDDVEALVAGLADARRVYELSDGNPLFVEELLAARRTQGLLRLPPLSSVRAVIRDRVARLPERTRKALLAAAVIGRDLRGRVVGEMVSEPDARVLLEPAVSLGMLVVTGPDRFRFSHALVAEALSEEAPAAERAALHLAAARALERQAPEGASAIAHHLLEAGELAAESAVSAAERAADRCMTQLAFEDAAAFYERAARALAAVSEQSKWRRAVLLCARAEALQHATQHAAAAALCDEAADIVRSLEDAPGQDAAALFARVALARGLEFRFGRTDPLLVAILREAIERLGSGSLASRAKLLARLAAAEQPSLDPREPVARALQAIELAQQLAPQDRLGVMYVATAALVDYVGPAELEPIQREILRLARGVDRWIAVHTHLRLCFIALLRSSRHDFEVAARTFAAEAEALGLPQWTRYEFMLKALAALLDGRFDDAEAAANRFEALSLEIGDTGSTFITDVHRAMAAWVRTAPQDLRVRARLSEYVPGRAAIAAWFACQEGALEPARVALTELAGRVPADPDMASMVASAVVFVGERDLAEKAYEVLSPRRGNPVLASMVGSAVMDLYDRLLLILAATTERWELIDEYAASALATAAKLGSPVWAARVEADWADALERRAREGDLERASELRTRAASAAERFGMPGLAARCRPREAKRPGGGRDRASPSADARVTCKREGGLWIVAGLGERVHVKDSRGMEMIARLLDDPGAPLHALDLVGASEPVDGGDAGPALDAKARSAYRARLAELVAERDDAESSGDRGRCERATAEIELVGAELERAFGLGGRERRVGATSERARTNVQRRIAHAVERVRAASPRLGEHLVASIRTGTYCVYEPRSQRP
ncbi:MAG TPA: AAA family ATPase [Polyangiaceae bacterium]|nr:AAA family ATPase [Polyangiaceae bacterium]